jgi:type III restriction enzyme
MALHPSFPSSPYKPLIPAHRWFPAAESLRDHKADQLLPPLVPRIREEVHAWRTNGYQGATATSRALLRWWFETDHALEGADGTLSSFRYYFSQREAVETVIWLHDVRQVKDKHDLLRFDASERLSASHFQESWPRYVLKLATGAGKTKVLSLLIAWSYFHKLYESGSTLARNILLIAPNIIVLDRLRSDFDGLKIFFNDPVLPENGHDGKNWRDDFQLTLHLQDEVRIVRPVGNLFLTNIHRVYLNEVPEPSLEDDDLTDYFLAPFGPKPVGKTNDSRADLGRIIREIDELAVFNDEAHHIHDEKMGWASNIRDIDARMRQQDCRLSLQIDVTATPRHTNGAIFAQTVSDYPLVEAIHQNVVKHPVLPDAASRAKLHDHKSALFCERYADYLNLGIEEWRKSFAEHQPLGKKAILFVMVDDTKNCDEVGEWLQKQAPELNGSVLVIHTKNNGDIAENATGKKQDELLKLRKDANSIDSPESPYKAIVSVLMLKEGWDVRNVTVIVGLRPYEAKSNILPEQTLGRGLRRMYGQSPQPERVSVLGTPAFMEFVEQIKSEGVDLDYVPMGDGAKRKEPLLIEVDEQKAEKEGDELDIPIPRMSRRFHREFKELDHLDPAVLGNAKLPVKTYSLDQVREIVFKDFLHEQVDHTIVLDGAGPGDWRSVAGFFARSLLRDLRLVSGYDVLYGKVRDFLRDHLFERAVDLDDPQVLRNLSEPEVAKVLSDAFRRGINALTVQDHGSARIEEWIKLRDTRPFSVSDRGFLQSKKTIFTKVVGEAENDGFELAFAAFLDRAEDVAAFAKNYQRIGFKLDYVTTSGDLSNYIPDFLVKATDGTVVIVETKGRAELDLPQKMARLRQWCVDATAASAVEGGTTYAFVFVDQESFEKHKPTSFAALRAAFTDYQS